MRSNYWSYWRWIICYASLQGPETAPQPAGKETGSHRYLLPRGENCTSCMNQTLSCLAIPNLTACSTSRLHWAKGLGFVKSPHVAYLCTTSSCLLRPVWMLLISLIFLQSFRCQKYVPVLFIIWYLKRTCLQVGLSKSFLPNVKALYWIAFCE